MTGLSSIHSYDKVRASEICLYQHFFGDNRNPGFTLAKSRSGELILLSTLPYLPAFAGSKINEQISLQLSPTLVHPNLLAPHEEENDVYALGVSGRI